MMVIKKCTCNFWICLFNVRQRIESVKEERRIEEENARQHEEESRKMYMNRKTHHLLSTQSSRGVYNSPTQTSLGKEYALASVSPFSKKERVLIEQSRQNAFLKTATGIPILNEESFTTNNVRLTTLPPLKDRVRPQVKICCYLTKDYSSCIGHIVLSMNMYKTIKKIGINETHGSIL